MYLLKHTPSTDNSAADTFSRLSHETDTNSLVVLRAFVDDFVPLPDLYKTNKAFSDIILDCQKGKGAMGMFTLDFRAWISFLGTTIMCTIFSSQITVDLGSPFGRTWYSLRRWITLQLWYYWPTMRQDTNQYICQCYTCQITKGRHSNSSLYTPLRVPLHPQTNTS